MTNTSIFDLPLEVMESYFLLDPDFSAIFLSNKVLFQAFFIAAIWTAFSHANFIRSALAHERDLSSEKSLAFVRYLRFLFQKYCILNKISREKAAVKIFGLSELSCEEKFKIACLIDIKYVARENSSYEEYKEYVEGAFKKFKSGQMICFGVFDYFSNDLLNIDSNTLSTFILMDIRGANLAEFMSRYKKKYKNPTIPVSVFPLNKNLVGAMVSMDFCKYFTENTIPTNVFRLQCKFIYKGQVFVSTSFFGCSFEKGSVFNGCSFGEGTFFDNSDLRWVQFLSCGNQNSLIRFVNCLLTTDGFQEVREMKGLPITIFSGSKIIGHNRKSQSIPLIASDVNFEGCIFRSIYKDSIQFNKVNLCRAVISLVRAKTIVILDSSLINTIFSKVACENLDLSGSNLRGVYFDSCNIKRTLINRCTLDLDTLLYFYDLGFRHFPDIRMEGLDFRKILIFPNIDLHSAVMVNSDLDERVLVSLVTKCKITVFSHVNLSGVCANSLVDQLSVISNLELNEISFQGATLDPIVFKFFWSKGCRDFSGAILSSLNFFELDIREIDFTSSRISINGSLVADFKNSLFESSQVRQLLELGVKIFNNIRLEEISFDKMDIRGVQLSNSVIVNSSLIGAKIDAIALKSLIASGVRDFSGANIEGDIGDIVRTEGLVFKNTTFRGAKLSRNAIEVIRKCGGVNFSGADLSGSDLSGLDCRGLRFSDTKLDGVKLERSILDTVSFSDFLKSGFRLYNLANLREVDFSGLDIKDCSFEGSEITASLLSGATVGSSVLKQFYDLGVRDFSSLNPVDWLILVGMDLRGVLFPLQWRKYISLVCSRLDRVVLGSLYLAETGRNNPSLYGTILSGEDLRGVCLKGACLECAKLVKSDLADADLSGANLKSADISGTNLSGCDLRGADLSNVTFDSNTNFRNAIFDNKSFESLYKSGARDFSSANLQEVSFSGFDMTQLILDNAKLNLESLVDITLNVRVFKTLVALGGKKFKSFTFVDSDFSSMDLREISIVMPEFHCQNAFLFLRSILDKSSFISFFMYGARDFSGATLVDIDFEYTDIDKCTLNDVVISGSSIRQESFKILLKCGVRAFRNVKFTGEIHFDKRDLYRVKFDDCTINNLPFNSTIAVARPMATLHRLGFKLFSAVEEKNTRKELKSHRVFEKLITSINQYPAYQNVTLTQVLVLRFLLEHYLRADHTAGCENKHPENSRRRFLRGCIRHHNIDAVVQAISELNKGTPVDKIEEELRQVAQKGGELDKILSFYKPRFRR